MIKRLNKRAQDLSIGTLILIVLGIIVLVLLVLGFSLGWSNLWEKVNIFGGGSSLDSVITACNVAATSNNQYNFCQDFKKVKVSGNSEYVNCQDSRIAGNIEKQLDCPPGYKDSRESVASYCAKLRTDEKFNKGGKTAIINGDSSCTPDTNAVTGTVDITKQEARQKACVAKCSTLGASPSIEQRTTYCCTKDNDIGLSGQVTCQNPLLRADNCVIADCSKITCPTA